jgi:hypothetical protein
VRPQRARNAAVIRRAARRESLHVEISTTRPQIAAHLAMRKQTSETEHE